MNRRGGLGVDSAGVNRTDWAGEKTRSVIDGVPVANPTRHRRPASGPPWMPNNRVISNQAPRQGSSIRRCEKCRHGSRPHVHGGFWKETTTLNEAVNVESYRWNCDKDGLAEAFSHSPPSHLRTRCTGISSTYCNHSILELKHRAQCRPGECRTLSPP